MPHRRPHLCQFGRRRYRETPIGIGASAVSIRFVTVDAPSFLSIWQFPVRLRQSLLTTKSRLIRCQANNGTLAIGDEFLRLGSPELLTRFQAAPGSISIAA